MVSFTTVIQHDQVDLRHGPRTSVSNIPNRYTRHFYSIYHTASVKST